MTEKGPLLGRTGLVTGAGRGIGAAIARKLASLGTSVVLCGRTLESLEATRSQIASEGGKATPIQCDVTNLQSVQAAAAQVEHQSLLPNALN